MTTPLQRFITENKLYSFEGRRGLINLCKIVGALGYKDPNYFGQLDSTASIGDLINFFEDNSGAIQAVVEWIGEQRSSDWNEELISRLDNTSGDEEEED